MISIKKPKYFGTINIPYICAFILTLLLISGCSKNNGKKIDPNALNIFVSIPPQKFLVESIGGKKVNVTVLAGQNQDPHTFEPTPSQIEALSKADIYFRIGVPFEGKLSRLLNKRDIKLERIDTDISIEKRYHRPDAFLMGPGSNRFDMIFTEYDPHIWLSPMYIEMIAKHIELGLWKVDPSNRMYFTRRFGSLIADLYRVEKKVHKKLKPYLQKTFYTIHPSFNYFAHAFGLKQKSFMFEGKPFTPKQLQQFIRDAQTEKITTLITQPQFDQRLTETIAAAIGCEVVMVDPLRENIFECMIELTEVLESSFKEDLNAQ